MFERTDEDLAAGLLRFTLAGREYVMHTLSWEASDAWQADARSRLAAITDARFESPDDLFGLFATSMGDAVELVAAYDTEHVLGRDAADLKSRFDKAQLYEVFKAILRHEVPPLRDGRAVISTAVPVVMPMLQKALAALGSRSPASTSSPSANGGSTPEPSALASIASRSASSGRQARTD
jgi:hypothetical protein